jgi:hypothetical protein
VSIFYQNILHFSILGAPCVLECLRKGEPTPEDPHPVFSLAMQGLRVCVSGFTVAQKEDLAEKIRSMGATYEKNLHKEALSYDSEFELF